MNLVAFRHRIAAALAASPPGLRGGRRPGPRAGARPDRARARRTPHGRRAGAAEVEGPRPKPEAAPTAPTRPGAGRRARDAEDARPDRRRRQRRRHHAARTEGPRRDGRQHAAPAGHAAAAADVVERQVLERMIVEKAELQFAVENGVRVDDTQLDRAVQRVAESNNMTVTQFRDRLEREGTPFAAFREELRQQIMIERARAHEVDDKVQVGEGEVDAFLAEQNGGSPDASPEVDVAQILLRVPESGDAGPDRPADARRPRSLTSATRRRRLRAGSPRRIPTRPEALRAATSASARSIASRSCSSTRSAARGRRDRGAGQQPERLPHPEARRQASRRRRRAAARRHAQAPVEQTHARHILIKVNEVVTARPGEGAARGHPATHRQQDRELRGHGARVFQRRVGRAAAATSARCIPATRSPSSRRR